MSETDVLQDTAELEVVSPSSDVSVLSSASQADQQDPDRKEERDEDTSGVTIVEALHKKYSDTGISGEVQIFVSKRCPRKTDSGQLHVPAKLGLNDFGVGRAGDAAQLGGLCGAVTDLDLAHNLLTSWSQVLCVVRSLPRLDFLNLSFNPLGAELGAHPSLPPDTTLTKLVLNGTRVPWRLVAELLDLLPRVSELHLSMNSYVNVDLPPGYVNTALTSLHLNNNLLAGFRHVVTLGRAFPALANLVLLQNRLGDFRPVAELGAAFPSLVRLNVSANAVREWRCVEQLRHLPRLTDLRLLGNPVTPKGQQEARLTAIAYLPEVTCLNGTRVTEEEREKAERNFVRHWSQHGDPPHRYEELKAKHGDVPQLIEVDMTPEYLRKVKVVFESKNLEHVLDVRKNVRSFKRELSSLLDIPVSQIRLFYQDVGLNQGADELKFPTRALTRLNVYNGDIFYVDRCTKVSLS